MGNRLRVMFGRWLGVLFCCFVKIWILFKWFEGLEDACLFKVIKK